MRNSDSRAANHILRRALEEPLRTICLNGGYDGAKVAELDGAPYGVGIDMRNGEVIDMLAAGIFDVASVCKAAARSAVSAAAMALTIDVLLHHENPQETYTP